MEEEEAGKLKCHQNSLLLLLFSPRNAAQKLEVVDLGKSSKHSFLAAVKNSKL